MDILSGDRMNTGELVNQIKSNIRFRITSARDMITGIRGESSMSPIQRRRELRSNRLSLIYGDEDMSESSEADVSEMEEVASGNIGVTSTRRKADSVPSNPSDTPSMSEVNEGTKKRAEDSGFSSVE